MRRTKSLLILLFLFSLFYYLAVYERLDRVSRTTVIQTNKSHRANPSRVEENAAYEIKTDAIKGMLEDKDLVITPDKYSDSELTYCRNLLKMEYQEREAYKPSPDLTTDAAVVDILNEGCHSFRKKYRFPDHTVKQMGIPMFEEASFPFAYSVVIHRELNQFALLLSAIYQEQNLYCVHVDKKSDLLFRRGAKLISQCFGNVFLSTKSEKVVYASFSRLQADVNCMRDLLHVPKTMYNWTYLINLCGQDFPASTNLEMVKQLKMLNGKNSIPGTRELNAIAKDRTKFIYRIKNVTISNETVEVDAATKEKHSPPPYGMTQIKNLAYNAFTRDFLQWALIDSPVGASLLNWSSFTHTPDEHFWSMLNTHPRAPGGSKFVSWWSVTRGVMWKGNKAGDDCHGYWQRGICVFGGEDLPWLMNSHQMFLNKFDVRHDATPLKCLRKFADLRASGSNSTWNRDKKPLIPPKQMLST